MRTCQMTTQLQKIEASKELMERIKEVKENVDAVDNFRIPAIKNTSSGLEVMPGEAPMTEVEVVMLHARKANIFYAKTYNKNDVTPPDCFSVDGLKPDASIKSPQHATCKGCPQAQFGTNQMKSGKACRNVKPLYLLMSEDAILPRQLTVTPTSLKAADQYLMNLTERGLNYRKVLTKIIAYKEDNADTYCKLKFQLVGKLPETRIADIEAIRQNLLPIMNAQAIDVAESQTQVQPAVNNSGEY